ncbi:MAG: methyltransferase domain-containing protein [Planctomycetes bacterium]|nr:methyltransferase domain-containing protein [Planctomycetota bacterium]
MASKSTIVKQQYEAWPYPHVPLLASVPSTHPWQLHTAWLWDRSGSGVAPERPRIWIAGCGTFQPYVFGLANPRADILATDLSERSLQIARRRCALRRMRHVRFSGCDLTAPSTWPDGTFDLIECYGVLMNLPDPTATLRALGERLTPGGVLRVMVYPHWSRARVFQIQRLARLLGLHAGERSHPALLRSLICRLPKNHPLRWAFANYGDSKNAAGVVDAFLHAGDRGFTGWQLGEMLAAAGVRPAFWFHRPWAQPGVMAERLHLQGKSQSFVLGYLDLWQELRGNFVVCLRRDDAPPPIRNDERAHPWFASPQAGLRHRLRLLALRTFGGRIPDRTGDESLRLRGADARAMTAQLDDIDPGARARLREAGLLLGTDAWATEQPAHAHLAGESEFVAAMAAVRVGRRAPNPLYAHLFAALEFDRRCPAAGLPDLDAQMGHWLPWADPLEQRPIHFGLTPFRTCSQLRVNVQDHLQRDELPVAASWNDVRLRQDAAALAQVRAFVRANDLPAGALPEAALRELWPLLFGQDSLFLTLD